MLSSGMQAGQTATIRVVDFMGNTVMNRTVRNAESVHEFALPRTAHGTYAVSACVGDSWIRERITVVRRR